MNKKEVSEIKKLFKLDNPYLTPGKSFTAYVSEQADIIWDRTTYFDRLEDEDRLAFYDIYKKVLSGGLGKNINEYSFSKDAEDKHDLVAALVEDGINEEKIKEYANTIISTLAYPFRWLLTITEFIYSVPQKKSKSKNEDENDIQDFEEFKFIICSVNEMDKKEIGLAWRDTEKQVTYALNGAFAAAKTPICGFLYPLFNERVANPDGFMSYSKDKTTPCMPLVVDILGGQVDLTPANENEMFHMVLKNTCGGALKFGLAKDICTEIAAIIRNNVEETEPPKIGITELKGILKRNKMDDALTSVEKEWKDVFGSLNSQILASNVTDEKKTTIKAPNVSISVTTEKTGYLEEKVIDGQKCIVIPVTDGGVTINEMDIE